MKLKKKKGRKKKKTRAYASQLMVENGKRKKKE